jgi:hypothetical protein
MVCQASGPLLEVQQWVVWEFSQWSGDYVLGMGYRYLVDTEDGVPGLCKRGDVSQWREVIAAIAEDRVAKNKRTN